MAETPAFCKVCPCVHSSCPAMPAHRNLMSVVVRLHVRSVASTEYFSSGKLSVAGPVRVARANKALQYSSVPSLLHGIVHSECPREDA